MAKKQNSESRAKAYRKRCAFWAEAMLKEYYDEGDIETSVGDCIADLMHLCLTRGWDFLAQYEQGRTHHNAEVIGGEHG